MGVWRTAVREGGLRRLAEFTAVLTRHGCSELAERLGRGRRGKSAGPRLPGTPRLPLPSPERLRRLLEDLGPSFVKLGQLMSTRADLLPPEYVEELGKLQDAVPPVSFEEIEVHLEAQWGQPLSRVFASIDPEPIGSASVAQVHLAHLPDGRAVAVKVIRPGIGRRIRRDLPLMHFLARRIERKFEVGRSIGAVNLVREFERTVFRELDMHIEAGNVEKFARNFAEVREIYIPSVHWEMTTRSVLVMEHLEGIKVDRVSEIRAAGIDPREIARIGMHSFSRQLLEFGYFHADPHAGNTLVLPDGRVGMVDFGIVGYLDEQMMGHLARIFLGYAEHDYTLVLDALEGVGVLHPERVDYDGFLIDLKDVSEPFYGRSLRTVSVRDVYDQVMGLALKHGLRLPRNLLLLMKTFLQVEALGKILDSDVSILETVRPYAQRLIERTHSGRRLFAETSRDLRIGLEYAREIPRLAHDIFRNVSRGKGRIEFAHDGLDPLGDKFERGLNRLTVGLVISACVVAAALVLTSTQSVVRFTVAFLGLRDVSLTAALGLTGYLIATLLGVWLIVAILRSGRL